MKSWIVRMKCEVIKETIVEADTAEDAAALPWDNVASETEVSMLDWEVVNVSPND